MTAGHRRDKMGKLGEQFANPRGFLGAVAGWLMSRSNIELNRWTISLLQIRPTDSVLEIGFGPGVGIELVSRQATQGCVVGVDPSEVMYRQASKRNLEAVRSGSVVLNLGDVTVLHNSRQKFDKVFAVNNVQFWTDPIETLKQVRSMMARESVIALTIQPRTKGATDETSERIGQTLLKYLYEAGFGETKLELRAMKPVTAVCAMGIHS